MASSCDEPNNSLRAQSCSEQGHMSPIRVFFKTIGRDLRVFPMLIKLIRAYKRQTKHNETIDVLFEKLAKKHPAKYAFIEVDGRTWTFQEVHQYSNALANYLQHEGYKAGDTIALFLENSPEIPIFWLALSKLGISGALINDNMRSGSLVHCIHISNAKAVIFSGIYSSAINDIRGQLGPDMPLYHYGSCEVPVLGATHLDAGINTSSTETPPETKTSIYDPVIYIYTSGTTGLPKAAIISHARYYLTTFSMHCLRLTTDDVIYDTLPLYHSAGGMLGAGQALVMGCTVVVRKKFSASTFWEDCGRYNCTAVQYIGELCRYLLAQPSRPTDNQHRVRVAIGNGLRPQIWTQFKNRFNIRVIGEFYGATEGNCGAANIDNTVGAVGFMSRIFSRVSPTALIQIQQDTGELIRDSNGVCIRCKPGEPGEMVGKVIMGSKTRGFEGYLDQDATNKKLTRDVFKKGDVAFRSGDILVMDDLGYLYFCDRIGDTYRWKGENVSTAEVEAVISNITKLNDAVSYGVQIPEMEGRAGMVAILEENGPVDLTQLYTDMEKTLPSYAIPVFIRILNNVDLTGTFKLQKSQYKKDGYDPDKVKGDRLYYKNNQYREYTPIDLQVYQRIQIGQIVF